MSKKEKIMKAVVCGVSGFGCLFAGFMMTAVSAEYTKQLLKKGEK